MVKTKSIKDPVEESDGTRILVTRYPVRFKKHKPPFIMEWARDVAPSKELLHDWRNEKISWKQYTVRYHEEMSSQKEAIRDFASRASLDTITLLCFEREDDPCCHRHLLKKLIEQEQQRNLY
jgi:uncharacterized protein YeaO (DUF488 family)